MLKRKLLILVLCLAFIFSSSSLLSCSCDDDKTISSLPQSIFVPTSNKDNITIGSVGNNEDNKADDKEHTHYWFDISVNKDTSSTNSVIVSGKCYECGDTLSKEVITLVDLDEWKLALSPSENKSFTENTGNTYTDYDENSSMSWRINNDTYTCEYFINSETKTSTSYMTNLFSGYSMMYGDFKYNNETKTYQYTVKDQMIIELGFANGRLFSYQSKSLTTGASTVNYYLNHNTLSIDTPSYFFEAYNEFTSTNSLVKSGYTQSYAEKLSSFFSSIEFDKKYELSYLENGVISVYFYFDEEMTDPILGEKYKSASIVSKNGVVSSATIGQNTFEPN